MADDMEGDIRTSPQRARRLPSTAMSPSEKAGQLQLLQRHPVTAESEAPKPAAVHPLSLSAGSSNHGLLSRRRRRASRIVTVGKLPATQSDVVWGSIGQ
jgi:hypothetical protein